MNKSISTLVRTSCLGFISLITLSFRATTFSHPHDLLAQCQLPNGKWVMCDQTKHDLKSNAHVKKNRRVKVLTLKQRRGKPGQRIKRIKARRAAPSRGRRGFAVAFSANCAKGFSKAGQQKFPNNTMKWYVCTTPVIQCPSYRQSNGKMAHVSPKVIIQLIGANPDGGKQKFRIQYKCTYNVNFLPVP